jgi:hypothetical protein
MRMHSLSPAVAALAALTSTAAAAQVRATVTADNAYMLGFGPANGPATWQAPVNNTQSGQIFSCNGGPEVYTINPGVSDYVYIAANSDKAITQGVLARLALTGGQVVVSGSPGWQVLPTGNDVALSAAAANAALASSLPPAWVNPVNGQGIGLVFGEQNTPSSNPNIFPVVCPSGFPNLIPGTARWMWYRSQPGMNPFNTNPPTGGHREFLIFRIAIRSLMCTCPRTRYDAVEAATAIDRTGRAVTADSTEPRPQP